MQRHILFCALAAAAIPFSLVAQEAPPPEGFLRIPPEEVRFKSPLGVGPDQAVLFGDPSKPGLYVIRVRFPPGAHSNPHFHSKDRHAVVLKGVWWNGTGPDLDFSKAAPMKAGAYVRHPAGGAHWDGAGPDEETIIQITGEGPVETTPIGQGPSKGFWPKPN